MRMDGTITVYDDLSIKVAEAGTGRPALILHGGGGPATVAGLAEHLSRTMHTITPVHPGWDGAHRPGWLTGVDDLAMSYLRLLRERRLEDVLVIGTSLGGWTAAEMAVRDTAGLIGELVLINGVGVHIEGEPIADVFALNARSLAELSWHDPDRFAVDPARFTPEELATRQANMATARAIAGDPYMHDPKLLRRVRSVEVPTLLLWGESDRIVSPAYGAAYAAAFGKGHFEPVPQAGHLPHVERPEATFAALDGWLGRGADRS